MEGQDDKGNNLPKPDKRFALWYMGWSSLDRRTTLPMLPWLVAEIRRKSEKNESGPGQAREVILTLMPPLIRCVPANSNNASVFIFEHKAQYISRFIHNSHDLTYFAYLIRSQPENPESEMACHVFKACDPNKVTCVYGTTSIISLIWMPSLTLRSESSRWTLTGSNQSVTCFILVKSDLRHYIWDSAIVSHTWKFYSGTQLVASVNMKYNRYSVSDRSRRKERLPKHTRALLNWKLFLPVEDHMCLFWLGCQIQGLNSSSWYDSENFYIHLIAVFGNGCCYFSSVIMCI